MMKQFQRDIGVGACPFCHSGQGPELDSGPIGLRIVLTGLRIWVFEAHPAGGVVYPIQPLHLRFDRRIIR